MAIWTLAKKEIRLLLRDRLAAIILLGMPLLFILILGLLLGEADKNLRISLVDLDHGQSPVLPGKSWAEVVRRDLAETAGVKVEILSSLDEAQRLIDFHNRAAVLVFNSGFSTKVNQCSFLVDGINPFFRDGVKFDKVDVTLLRDAKQPGTAAVIEQVVQVTLLRVLMPWMIGKAFEKLSDDRFINILGTKVNLPVPEYVPTPQTILVPPKYRSMVPFLGLKLDKEGRVKTKDLLALAEVKIATNAQGDLRTKDLLKLADLRLKLDESGTIVPTSVSAVGQAGGLPVPWQIGWTAGTLLTVDSGNVNLNDLIALAARDDPTKMKVYRDKVGAGVQAALAEQFKNYDLTGKTWADLTRSKDQPAGTSSEAEEGGGLLNRGAQRYQMLVPAYTVMFAFFLVMNVGWIFVSERREGTLKRLRASPLTRGQILLGKLVPYFLLSLGQGALLLVAGRLVFGMRWGPESWPLGKQVLALLPVVFCTSLAAMGLALLVAAVSRSEIQVALFGAVPVLLLALIGGCVLPREMMSEQAQQLSFLTPQGWALDAYRELLYADPGYVPNITIVARACAVLAGFGLAFIGLAWGLLRLD